jgi:hypothetical protein
MEFQRSPRQTLMVLINLFVVAGVAAWCLSDAWFGGGGLNWILGGVFGVWGAFILQSFLRRRVFIRLERHGVLINAAIRPVRFEFEDLVWANLDEGTRICFFAYADRTTGKTRYTGISRKRLGAQAVAHLRTAVYNARPDLPDSDPSVTAKETQGA